MKIRNLFNFNLKTKQNFWGYFFIFPLIIGFILFFVYPFIQSILFSLSELELTPIGFRLNYRGLTNYRFVFYVHGSFTRVMIGTIYDMLRNVPLIVAFAFFAAMLLNQKFKGRLLARTIFFLPVIMSAGVVLSMEQGDVAMQMVAAEAADGEFAGVADILIPFLEELRMPEVLINYVLYAIDYIPEIIRASGVQILVFLAGLQSIPSSLYEASKVEGATSWENFWLITLPLLSPLILTNIVYTVIDYFTNPTNELIQLIEQTKFGGAGFGVSAAMAWIYFIFIAVFLAVVVGLISRKVFYIK